ncbi:MAG TPA: iron-sulfur cluster insertion protein ErpA, partial [Longimicrobium sp.]|nr:iron-sulfur cluster insertion protein ErpA [Longimicrobium sp.]
ALRRRETCRLTVGTKSFYEREMRGVRAFTHRAGDTMQAESTTTRTEAPASPVLLTPTAAVEVRRYIEEQGAAESAGLRVGVLPGGCSGFQYGLNIEDEPTEDDLVLESEGIRMFVDPFSLQYLNGTEIDYVSTFQGSGFTFNNPNASGGCGCGSSFTV